MRAVIAWLVDHATTVGIVVFCIFFAGLRSYITLPRESNPDITIPVVLVSTPYIGVAPEDVEGLVTIPLENELAGLQDVKAMKSTSAEGVSIISIEFEPDVVIEEALQKVRDGVSRAKPKLPEDAEEPAVQEISFTDIPIVMVTIAGDVDESVLKKLADQLKDEATRIPGVLDATVSGGVEREIQVGVYPERLTYYGLALHDVTGAIENENVNIPGGTVRSGHSTTLLRVPGEFTKASQIEDVAVKRVGDRPVFIRDIARVDDTTAERETYARMNGRPCVTLSITKRAGSNILEVAQAVKALTQKKSTAWPDGVKYQILGDQSEGIEISVTDLQNNIITALILVVGVLLFFMGFRNSIFVALAIPLSMLASFMVLDTMGFTLNMVVLFSLMIALGMLVDNAIVVVENVYRHAELGADRRTAAIEGTREVAVAVAASTATTVAAFFPMVFWPGIMGEFMSFLPKTVIIVLTASLFVAIAILPVFLSRLIAVPKGAVSAEEKPLSPVMRAYKGVLELSIRFRYLTAFSGFAALALTVFAYSFLNHGTEMFPATEPDRANIFVLTPEGTDLETTDRIVRQIEGVLAQTLDIDVWVAEPGVQSDGNALGPSSSASNQARITLDFLPTSATAKPGEAIRRDSTTRTIERLRETFAQIPGASIRVEQEMMGPPVGKPIGVQVSGPDFHQVGELSIAVRRAIAAIPGVVDLSDDYRVGRPELPLRINRGAAKRIGVSTAEIGNTIRTVVAGAKASALRDGEEEYDIVVRLAPEYRSDIQSVLNIRVPGRLDTSPKTFAVPLSSVASYALSGGTGAVKHIDQDLVVTIEGDVADGVNAVAAQTAVAALIADYPTPAGFHIQLAGSTDDQREAEAFLTRAFLIAVALILMILVTQFDSLWIPLIILATVALSFIGVLWGLILTGTPFGIIMTGIGVVSLAGVVVNNAIVLLDYVQQRIHDGQTVHDSLIQAGLTRFRPVMLTAITTTLGLVPMAIGVSVDFTRFRLVVGSVSAQWWGPMAVAVIFGLSFATVLTLVMVPTLYSIYDDVSRLPATLRAKLRPAATLATIVWIGMAGSSARAETLDDAFHAARSHSVAHRMLAEQTKQASVQRHKAWSALSPRLSVSGTRVINEFAIAIDFADSIPDIPGLNLPETDPIVIQKKAFWQANLTLSQRVFSGTAVPALKSTFKMYQAAKLTEEHESSRLKISIARAFYGVIAAREAVTVSQSGLKTNESQLTLAQRQVEAGLAPRQTLLSAELRLSQARRDLLSAREQQTIAEEALHRLTGFPRDVPLTMPTHTSPPLDLSDALERAQGRPDLRASSLQEQASKLRTLASDMRWMPTVDAQFQYLYNQNTGFQSDPTQWRIALVGTWQLWDGGLRLAESAAYRSQRRVAALKTEQLTAQAEEEIRTSFETYRRATEEAESVQAELSLAEENLRLAEAGFQAGSSTWIEVQQAEMMLQASKLSAIQQRMRRDLAALELRLATGSL